MNSLNRVSLIGNLGHDPEVRSTQDGRQVASFSLATSESWKDKSGDKKERTEWHKVVVFNENLISAVKSYVKKGSKLYVEGSLHTRKWTDKDGNEKYSTEVVLQNFGGKIILLDSVSSARIEHNAVSDDAVKEPKPQGKIIDDEIPF